MEMLCIIMNFSFRDIKPLIPCGICGILHEKFIDIFIDLITTYYAMASSFFLF